MHGAWRIFIRYAVAHDIVSLMKYSKLTVAGVGRRGPAQLPKEEGGVGGVIALDAQRQPGHAFNTEGMYRGYVTSDGKIQVAIYEE